MTNYDPKKFLPKDGWALLLADKRQNVSEGGIILGTGETGLEKVTELAGRVVRIGGGDLCAFMRKQGLEEGCRVLFRGFLKYANPLPTDEKWEDGSDKEYFLIDCNDIMAVVGEGVDTGCFSGSRAAPHLQPVKN